MAGTRISIVCAIGAFACIHTLPAIAGSRQEAAKPAISYPAGLPRLDELARRIASRETELFSVWLQYTYRQYTDIRVEYLGKVTKESLQIVSEVVFLDDGRREVRVIERRGGFSQLKMGPGVEEVLNNLMPFALTERELPNYALEYLRSERLGRKLCHVLGVQPKVMEDGKVYFEGEIWVDAKNLQIVRTVGRPVPQSETSPFPDFDTVRETIDGKYLFPARTVSNSLLAFPKGAIRIQQIVQYKNYRRFGANVKVGFPAPAIHTLESGRSAAPRRIGALLMDATDPARRARPPCPASYSERRSAPAASCNLRSVWRLSLGPCVPPFAGSGQGSPVSASQMEDE